ncbi:hypothetical protein [Arthrobacter sp. EPSL27]|uniref:hypothetical protein n=1 Tax=Arthrobacter sp. EPSL27 TaxID=1745378 RepID=UPI000747179E|nr:hypothetical protein [Arthrobacter sp. EPSL27]KUM32833.1 hypothetical protein AR539_12490 [Arthrobacter sp. EPSL27]
MTAKPNLAAFAGVHSALEAFSKAMPAVDPAIFRTQEMIGAEIKAAFEPITKSTNTHLHAVLEPFVQSMNLQLQAAFGLQELQKQIAMTIAPTMDVFRQVTVPALTSIAATFSAIDLAAQLPDLSVLAHFGEMVAAGEFAPDFVDAAHAAVDGVVGYSEEIQDFSLRETVASVFDAKVIADGTYIFVFIVWLVGSLWVAGLGAEAKAISDAVGFSSAAGSHVVAKEVSSRTMKVVIKKRNTRRR